MTSSDSAMTNREQRGLDRFAQVEDVLLGEPRVYSRKDVDRELGLDIGDADRVWRAFGFADAGRDQAIYTEEDLAAMRLMTAAYRLMPQGTALASARATGHAMARLAEWQAQRLDEFDQNPDVEGDVAQMALAMGRVQDLIWRHHLAGALRGLDASRIAHAGGGDDQELVVGFCDIVGYTALSRKIGMDRLAALLEVFEERATDIITTHGGQVIKSLGDAVMFTVDYPTQAARIGLELHALTERDTVPPLRVGLAYGRVLTRFGDVFGEPANIAARLTSSARAGTTLCDTTLADAVDDDLFVFKSISPLSVRGYRRLRARVIDYDKTRDDVNHNG